MAQSFKQQVQQQIRSIIVHRRQLVYKNMSRKNEVAVAQKIKNLEYYNARLTNDKHAATFLKNQYANIKALLPKHSDKLKPHGSDKLEKLYSEACQKLQPTKQLQIYINQ